MVLRADNRLCISTFSDSLALRYRLEPASGPTRILLMPEKGEGILQVGICEMEGQRLKILFFRDDQPQVRFDDEYTIILERTKP